MIKIKLNFYELNTCGYYSKGNNRLFANCSEVFNDFIKWIQQKQPTIQETQTYNVNEESETLPCFNYDILKNSKNDFLVTLWNKTPTVNHRFASVKANDQVGNVSVSTANIPSGNIPGYPSYFYIIPSENLVISLMINSPITGIKNFSKYFKGYLTRFSSWVVLRDMISDELDVKILGYRENENDKLQTLNPRFKTTLKRIPGQLEQIKNNREKIRKLIQKDEFSTLIEKKQGMMTSFLNYIGGIQDIKNISEKALYKFEFDYTPRNDQELNKIINTWEKNTSCSWSDVGFKFQGDDKTYWLGKTALRHEIEIPVEWPDSSIFSASLLLDYLSSNENRSIILEKWNNEENN